jgi:predicted TIM-barrel fold metal-dependent hydrolase
MEQLGLKGVKLHPDMQRFDIDDPRMMHIYEMLSGRMPVLFHTGDYRHGYSHPERLARVLDAFPRLTAIAAHFGGWSIYEQGYDYLGDKRCYLDICSSMALLGPRRSRELIRAFGAERMLFGTDFPMWDPKEELDRFYAMGLTSAEQELILHKNAERVLGIGNWELGIGNKTGLGIRE